MFNLTIKYILPLIFLIAPLSVIAHEIGHVIGAKIVKANYTKLSIGQGRKIYTLSKKSFTMIIHLLYFIGGHATSERVLPYNSKDIIIISIFGPMVNIVLGFIFYEVYIVYSQDLILLLSLFNLWLGFTNLIPFKYKNNYSDGYVILNRAIRCNDVKNKD